MGKKTSLPANEPSSFAFGGSVDEFTLYQYQLTAAQVAQLYTAATAG